MNCPSCSQNRAHRSHRAGLQDYLMGMVNRRPYRCHNCGVRFYAYRDGEESPKLRTAEERRVMALRRTMRWKRSKQELAVLMLGVLALAAMIYYLIQQRIDQ